MSRMMLIDSSHPEQTRVVVTDKGRVVEFDVEAATKKQTVGNIYLAKVTRVEPSLQAAFVEYGSGRQGFLPFSEIHPDYYQIPKEDRQRLLEEENAYLEAQAKRQEEEEQKYLDSVTGKQDKTEEEYDESEAVNRDDDFVAGTEEHDDNDSLDDDAIENCDNGLSVATQSKIIDDDENSETLSDEDDVTDNDNDDPVEVIVETKESVRSKKSKAKENSDDSEDKEDFKPRRPRYKRYKIQEVIKKRQILLIQVVKGERGNKGASLTTYLSLAGRYCVLMPNTAHGGGISRKITQVKDRQNLKKIVSELEVPRGMGLIIRTAGANRTKVELKRDYEYLTRMWDNVRELTMNSIAPSLVYEEGSLVKRAIRDIYSKDIPKVFVQGEDAYKEAREFMRLMTPSHMRNIQHYKDPLPLFSRYQIERQLEELSDQVVQLKSGGYLVINQTEALVAIDINSGRSTNEFSVEDTALKTNLEAADEISRQLRLRDLAGLVVIDFIDMEDYRNVRAVERRMKDAIKQDKARIQLARISIFGLMEMTRQRLRPAMQDILSNVCPHCKGAGHIVSVESGALRIIRRIFEEIASHKPASLTAKAEMNIANFILNQKRAMLARCEEAFNVEIIIEGSSALAPTEYNIETVARQSVDDDPSSTEDNSQISQTEKDIPYQEDNAKDEERERASRKKGKRRRRGHNDNDALAEVGEDQNSPPKDNKKERHSRDDKQRKQRNTRKGRGRNAAFTPEAETFTTVSGTVVLIENPVSVLEKSSVNHEASEPTEQQEPDKSQDNNVSVASEDIVSEVKNNNLQDIIEEPSTSPYTGADTSIVENVHDTSVKDIPKDIPQEAVLEDAMAGATQANDTVDTPKPARRGWWRSRFGL